MNITDIGYVIASRYNVTVVSLSRQQSKGQKHKINSNMNQCIKEVKRGVNFLEPGYFRG